MIILIILIAVNMIIEIRGHFLQVSKQKLQLLRDPLTLALDQLYFIWDLLFRCLIDL